MAGNYARRPGELRDFQTALQLLETEVIYAATPLPVALRKISGFGCGKAAAMFSRAGRKMESGLVETAGEAWISALGETFEETALRFEDREVLEALAPSLGASDRQEQLKHLALARERLGRQEAAARDDAGRYGRLWNYAGVLAGLALVLILI